MRLTYDRMAWRSSIADLSARVMTGSGSSSEGRDEFSRTLRAAIDASGLGLERIQHHLRERGADLSVATLSYWQSGRSVPGRRTSFTALTHLENVLGLRPGELASLVPRRTTDSRGVDSVPPLGEVMGLGITLPGLVAELDSRVRRQLETVSEHNTITVGPDRAQHSRWVRHVVRAAADGADRMLLFNHHEDDDAPLPTLVPLVHCTNGPRHVLSDPAVVVSELLFDRALDKGESIIVEYRVEYAAPFPRYSWHELRRRMSLREFVLEIRFDPAAVPTRCEWYERDLNHELGDVEVLRPVPLDGTHAARVIQHDLSPSAYGLRWTWDDQSGLGETPTG